MSNSLSGSDHGTNVNVNIALYGRTGAGKTAVAKYLVDDHGFARCATGSACRWICRTLFDSESKTLLNQVTDALKAIDEDVWLRAALSVDVGGKPIVFDSMRFGSDYRFLKNRGFTTWKIVAPLDVRLARLKARGQEFDVAVDEYHPGETQLENYAFDAVIENGGLQLPPLHKSVENELARLQ